MSHDSFGRWVCGRHNEFGKPISNGQDQFGYPIRIVILDNVPPIVTVISFAPTKLSFNSGFSQCTVKFKLEEDVKSWELRAGGQGPGQGTLVENGSAALADTEIFAYIDASELPYEGSWRISIYAQDKAGNWTPYDDSR